MNHAAEADLIARCQAGNEAAFAELVDQYKNLVFGVIARVVSDRSRVEDLAQDVFLKIYRGLPSFRGDAKLSTWIYRIIINVCSQARSPNPATVSLDEQNADGRPKYQPASVDCAFTDLDLRDQMEKAMAQLPDEWRLLIAAHYFGGQPYQELADTFGMPIGTVKTHLHRAKQKLRMLIVQGAASRDV
jgi:RNA polymerase sigma-70 factor (ECF subfamily)